jgi:hypothetical protein
MLRDGMMERRRVRGLRSEGISMHLGRKKGITEKEKGVKDALGT